MRKIGAILICTALTVAVITSGCSSNTEDYGTIKTVTASNDFEGNIGEVKIESGDTYAVIKIQGFEGEIKCKLFPEAAPEGVQNFIDTANSGYYNGKEIHRVIKNFMIQGGSENGDGMSTDSDPKFYVEYNSKMRHFYGALCYANGGGVNGRQFYIVNNKSYTPVTIESLESGIDDIDDYISQIENLLKTASGSDKAVLERNLEYYKNMKASTQSSIRAIEDNTEAVEEKYEEVGGTPHLDGGYTVFGQTVEGFEVIDAVSGVEVETPSGSNEKSHPIEKVIIESVTIHTAE